MLFEIIRAPQGNSPAWVRDGWIGVQFQALQAEPITVQTRSAGAQGGILGMLMNAAKGIPPLTQKHGYPANARDLLGLLALNHQRAAQWYIDNAPQMLDPKQMFIFEVDCCHLIPDVSGLRKPVSTLSVEADDS